MNSEPSESWNPLVVDISSDEETDKFESNSNFESMYRWLNDIAVESDSIIVDLDKNVLSMDNYSSLRPKSSRAENDKSRVENDKNRSENDKRKTGNNESDDDCMILDGDPDKIVEVCDDNKKNSDNESDDLQIVGEKGQIACRDFPHSRHLCANFPFKTTPHEQHCNLCHCFVCDSPAPCIYWHSGDQSSGHCHATDKDEMWKNHRKTFKTVKSLHLPSPKPLFELQNIDMITNHTRAPIRPCSNASTTLPINEQHINHTRLIKSTTMPRSKGFGLYRSAHNQRKRVGSIGSGFTSLTMNQSQQRSSVPNQMHRHARKVSFRIQPPPTALPRSQSMPMTSPRSSRTPRTTQTEDSRERWQDVLAGMAAELGVSDAINSSSTMPSQTSQSTASQSVSNLDQLQHTDIESNAHLTNSTNQNIGGNSDIDCYYPADINFLPELSAVDPTSFSYDFDDSWI